MNRLAILDAARRAAQLARPHVEAAPASHYGPMESVVHRTVLDGMPLPQAVFRALAERRTKWPDHLAYLRITDKVRRTAEQILASTRPRGLPEGALALRTCPPPPDPNTLARAIADLQKIVTQFDADPVKTAMRDLDISLQDLPTQQYRDAVCKTLQRPTTIGQRGPAPGFRARIIKTKPQTPDPIRVFDAKLQEQTQRMSDPGWDGSWPPPEKATVKPQRKPPVISTRYRRAFQAKGWTVR